MFEKRPFTPAEIAHDKAQACLEIAFDQIKRQASSEQCKYLCNLFYQIDNREDAYPIKDTLKEVFQVWCRSGEIAHTELYNDLQCDFPDIYDILERWFKRAKPFFYATGHDGVMTPFKRYQQMPAISYTENKNE